MRKSSRIDIVSDNDALIVQAQVLPNHIDGRAVFEYLVRPLKDGIRHAMREK